MTTLKNIRNDTSVDALLESKGYILALIEKGDQPAIIVTVAEDNIGELRNIIVEEEPKDAEGFDTAIDLLHKGFQISNFMYGTICVIISTKMALLRQAVDDHVKTIEHATKSTH